MTTITSTHTQFAVAESVVECHGSRLDSYGVQGLFGSVGLCKLNYLRFGEGYPEMAFLSMTLWRRDPEGYHN